MFIALPLSRQLIEYIILSFRCQPFFEVFFGFFSAFFLPLFSILFFSLPWLSLSPWFTTSDIPLFLLPGLSRFSRFPLSSLIFSALSRSFPFRSAAILSLFLPLCQLLSSPFFLPFLPFSTLSVPDPARFWGVTPLPTLYLVCPLLYRFLALYLVSFSLCLFHYLFFFSLIGGASLSPLLSRPRYYTAKHHRKG